LRRGLLGDHVDHALFHPQGDRGGPEHVAGHPDRRGDHRIGHHHRSHRSRMIRAPILFLNVLIIAACGLIYELLAGTVASYVIGDSVTQFSLIIGLYLSALGVGAWLSRFIENDLAGRFVEVELAVALVGGLSAPML